MGMNQNPQSFEKKVLAMIDGFRVEFPASPQQVVLGGKHMTLTQVHARLLRGTMGRNKRASITLAGEPALYVFGADGKPLPGQTPVPATTAPTKAEADDTEEIEPKPTGLE